MTLDDSEVLELWLALRDGHAAVSGALTADLDATRGFSLDWFEALMVLQQAGGRVRMNEFAGALKVPKSTLSRLVDRLVDAELVDRRVVEADGRGQIAAITSFGRQEYRRVLPAYRRSLQRNIARTLTATDAQSLRRALGKLSGSAD